MSAFEKLSEYYPQGLLAKARELNYSKPNLLILEGKEDELRSSYREIYDKIKSCEHNRDERGYMEYARDVVATWIFEDDYAERLSKAGLKIELAGADRQREILSNTKISSGSDYKVSLYREEILLELVCDYNGFWKNTGKLHLRDEKYIAAKRDRILLLGISTRDEKYLLLDFANEIEGTYIESHAPYGRKSAYEIQFDKSILREFSAEEVVKRIRSSIEARMK